MVETCWVEVLTMVITMHRDRCMVHLEVCCWVDKQCHVRHCRRHIIIIIILVETVLRRLPAPLPQHRSARQMVLRWLITNRPLIHIMNYCSVHPSHIGNRIYAKKCIVQRKQSAPSSEHWTLQIHSSIWSLQIVDRWNRLEISHLTIATTIIDISKYKTPIGRILGVLG